MSYEVYVYSAVDTSLPRNALLAKLRDVGWEAVFVSDWKTLRLAADGDVADDVVLSGPPTFFDRTRVMGLLEAKNKEGIEQQVEQGGIASCAILVARPYNFTSELNDGETADLADAIGSERVAFMRKAKTLYAVRTNMGRTSIDFELQRRVWQAIGELTGGLMEDPQAEEYRFHADPPPAPEPSTAPSPPCALRPRAPFPWGVVRYAALLLVSLLVLAVAILPVVHTAIRYVCLLVAGPVLLRFAAVKLGHAWTEWKAAQAMADAPIGPGSADESEDFGRLAERNGIPVKWTRQGWSIATAELSLEQVERLVKLETGFVGSLPETRTRMCGDILLEFKSGKGKKFFEANRAWFDAMQRTYVERP